jgi:nitrogen fixation protein NifU and related proteins
MFSKTVMHHFQNPRNVGEICPADRIGRGGAPDRGLYMVVTIRLAGDEVADIKYQTVGCGAAIAAGSVMTELAKGRTAEACRAMTTDTLIEALDGLPDHKRHCAELAIEALHGALSSETSD